MRLPEGDPPAREIVSQFGCKSEVFVKFLFKPPRIERDGGKHSCKDINTGHHRIRRIKKGFLVLLHVPVIGKRQSLHYRQQRDEVAVHTAGLSAYQFGHVGVLLLRHDAAAGRECVTDGRKAPFV